MTKVGLTEPNAPSLRSKWKSSITLTPLAVLLATALVFIRIPSFDFVTWDDQLHVYENPYLAQFKVGEIGHFWVHPYAYLYIPISYTVFALLSIVAHRPVDAWRFTDTGASLDPHIFHMASLCVHLCNVLLVFLLLRRLTRQDYPAAIGTLVFAIHPLQVESVAWVSELRGLLGGLFALLTIHSFIDYTELKELGKRRLSLTVYGLSVLGAVCAVLSKPSYVIVFLLIFIIALFACGRSWKSAAIETLPFLALGAVFTLVTARVQVEIPGDAAPIWLRPFVACDSFAFYLAKFFVPINLAIDYGRRPNWLLSHWWAYVDWLIPALALFIAYSLRRQRPYLVFGAAFAGASLIPVVGFTPFLFQHASTVADRYAYLSLIGAAIIISSWLASLPASGHVARYAILVWIVVIALLSYLQTFVWRDSDTLFANAVVVNPNSAVAQTGYAFVLQMHRMYALSLSHYALATALDPTNQDDALNLGLAYKRIGDPQDEERQLRRAIALYPAYVDAHNDLAQLLMSERRYDEGAGELEDVLRFDPADTAAAEQLGLYFSQRKDYASAANVYLYALRRNPKSELLWRNLGLALCGEERYSDSVAPLETALELDPSDKLAGDVLGIVRQMLRSGTQ